MGVTPLGLDLKK